VCEKILNVCKGILLKLARHTSWVRNLFPPLTGRFRDRYCKYLCSPQQISGAYNFNCGVGASGAIALSFSVACVLYHADGETRGISVQIASSVKYVCNIVIGITGDLKSITASLYGRCKNFLYEYGASNTF
jgi:hypothetical protein